MKRVKPINADVQLRLVENCLLEVRRLSRVITTSKNRYMLGPLTSDDVIDARRKGKLVEGLRNRVPTVEGAMLDRQSTDVERCSGLVSLPKPVTFGCTNRTAALG